MLLLLFMMGLLQLSFGRENNNSNNERRDRLDLVESLRFTMEDNVDNGGKDDGNNNFKGKYGEKNSNPIDLHKEWDNNEVTRHLKSKKSKKKTVNKLESCKDDLEKNKKELDTCQKEQNSPHILFVQMAKTCTISQKKNGKYFLTSSNINKDTWQFTDRPLRHESIMQTARFVKNFEKIFNADNGGFPNAAFTFVDKDKSKPNIPLVSEIIHAEYDGNNYSYELKQSKEQKDIFPLDSFFIDPDSDDEITYDDCSIFIDAYQGHCPDGCTLYFFGCNNGSSPEVCDYCFENPQDNSCDNWEGQPGCCK